MKKQISRIKTEEQLFLTKNYCNLRNFVKDSLTQKKLKKSFIFDK